MATPKLVDVAWLGPKDEMDRASDLFGKCDAKTGVQRSIDAYQELLARYRKRQKSVDAA